MDRDPLKDTAVLINGGFYKVMDFPYEKVQKEGPKVLRKAVAYRFDTDMTKGLFPYRGVIDHRGKFEGEKWNPYTNEVGVYLKEMKDGSHQVRIAYPRTKQDKEEYRLGRERDVVAAVINNQFVPDQFADLHVNVNTAGEAFMPPMHIDDDPLNKIAKAFIRRKGAPFDPYGKRLEVFAVDKSRGGVEGTNIRNNSKRSIINNKAMSSSKFVMYGDVWEYVSAIILTDAKNTMNPACEDGEAIVIFPHGEFDIGSLTLTNVDAEINEAINETNSIKRNSNDDEED